LYSYCILYVYTLLIFCAGKTEHKGLTCSAGTASSGTAWPAASSYHPLLLQPALHQTKQLVSPCHSCYCCQPSDCRLPQSSIKTMHTSIKIQNMTAFHSSWTFVSMFAWGQTYDLVDCHMGIVDMTWTNVAMRLLHANSMITQSHSLLCMHGMMCEVDILVVGPWLLHAVAKPVYREAQEKKRRENLCLSASFWWDAKFYTWLPRREAQHISPLDFSLINAKRRSTSFCFFPFAEPVYIPLPLHRFGPDARGSTPQAQHAVAGRALCMHVETPLIGHHEGAALRVGAVQLGSLWYGCFCCHLHVDNNNNSNNNNNNNNSNYTVLTMKLVV